MSASGGALNLSLLSRGIGEVKNNGHERVDVIFEPQDYYNFVDEEHERPFFLPPIQPHYGYSAGSQFSSRYGPKEKVYLPKTFTTRKGALLLFSEDMAHRTRHTEPKRHRFHHSFHPDDQTPEESTLSESMMERDLRTVDDLARCILSYGNQHGHGGDGEVNLKFVHDRRRPYFDRQIRPGFSAKRYLSTWTRSWDDSVLEKVISKGYLTEKSLFYYNPLLPHLTRRLNDDLSHYPTPYKLMRSMLMSPGSLSGYTFYRVRPESQETDYPYEDQEETTHSVKVVSTHDGVQREVHYEALDQKGQKEVLTDLLVKSAVHYAMKKQQEYAAEYMDEDRLQEIADGERQPKPITTFDMKEAVETLLLDHKEVPPHLIGADFPDVEERSQKSGSFKGGKLAQKQAKEKAGSPLGIMGLSSARDKDGTSSAGSVPGMPVLPPIGQTYTMLTPIGEASREHTQHTQAWSLQHPLTDADSMMPQVNIVPSTPQHSTLTNPPTTLQESYDSNLQSTQEFPADEEEGWAGHKITERDLLIRSQREVEEKRRKEFERRRAKVSQQSLDLEGPTVKGGSALMSSSESLEPGSTHSVSSGFQATAQRQPWKGSTQSLRSHGSRQHSGSGGLDDKGSMQGSVVLGPEGELINVGGTIRPHMRPSDAVQDIHDANLVPGLRDVSDDSDTEMPDAWRDRQATSRKPESFRNFGNKRGTPKSQLTEQDIIDTIASHASQIAESVLSQSDTGMVLEDDIRRAAELWMEAHPPRDISRSQSLQDLPDRLLQLRVRSLGLKVFRPTVIQEVMRAQKRNSAGPTVAEYRDQIRQNLITTIARAAGIDQSSIPPDAEIDPQLMEDLANNRLSPDDIEIVRDESSGRSFIKSRNRRIEEAMGGVEKGHLYMPAAKAGTDKAEKGRRISIPSERAQQADVGEPDVIHYQGIGEEETDKLSQKTPSVKAGSVKVPSERAPSEKTTSVKAPSLGARSIQGEADRGDAKSLAGKSGVSFKDEVEQQVDDFQKALATLERPTSEPKKSDADVISMKSGESQKSDDKKSKISSKKATTPEKREEFVVGKPKEKKKPSAPTAPKKDGKKPKKGAKKGKKKEEVVEPPTAVEETPKEAIPKLRTPSPQKAPTPAVSEREQSPEFVPTEEEEEEEMEFVIIRDQSPSPEPEIMSQEPTAPSPEEEQEEEQYIEEENEEEMADKESDNEADKLRMISNREARAAKRAAAAEKRRQDVERKRREREEELKKQKEEQERQEKLKAELEEQRKKKEEERRQKKQRELDAQAQQEQERLEQEKRKQAEQERERKMKEDYARKLEEMKKKQAEEEKKRKEEAERKRREEEERRLEEEALMATMAEQERLEYERKKREEEEERIRKEEEEKRRREEEAQRALEEAKRLAEEMARKQAELEARLKFNRTLQLESSGLNHTQDITKAFVFSYFELLTWLGLDIPEFELLKLNQY